MNETIPKSHPLFTTRFTKDFHKEHHGLQMIYLFFVNVVGSLCPLW